jgi:selenide,water dikinase
LKNLPKARDKRVMVGVSLPDDAAVYRVSRDTALVASLDFFTPIVDDPYAYGAIAAANALSDVYAMGAEPLFALNILTFPCDALPGRTLTEILRGGAEKAREAGIAVVGGHSVRDAEPKYGLCVVGRVHPGKLVAARGARPGDALVLTKPLGTGVITTAIKGGKATRAMVRDVTRTMTELNRGASRAMVRAGAHAATDVTGFGFLNHLHTILLCSKAGAEVWSEKIPLLRGALELAREGFVPGGSHKNFRHAAKFTRFAKGISKEERLVLADAQTSGGLLIAVPQRRKAALLRSLKRAKTPAAAEVGKIVRSKRPRIEVVRAPL